MELFINKHYFIHVKEKENMLNHNVSYVCRVMKLLNTRARLASITDDRSKVMIDACWEAEKVFDEILFITSHIDEVFNFHKRCLLQLLQIEE